MNEFLCVHYAFSIAKYPDTEWSETDAIYGMKENETIIKFNYHFNFM